MIDVYAFLQKNNQSFRHYFPDAWTIKKVLRTLLSYGNIIFFSYLAASQTDGIILMKRQFVH